MKGKGLKPLPTLQILSRNPYLLVGVMKDVFAKFQSLPLPKKLCLGAVALLPVLLIVPIFSLTGNATSRFVPASRSVSKSLLDKVIQENYRDTGVELDRKQIKALLIQGSGCQRLYVFNFNNSQLCGIAGCLYVAYTQEGNRVLNLYLQPNLPKGRELLAVERPPSETPFIRAI